MYKELSLSGDLLDLTYQNLIPFSEWGIVFWAM